MRAPGTWFSQRHSLRTEILTVVAIYLVYEVSRGIAVGDPGVALRHAREVAELERSWSIFVQHRGAGGGADDSLARRDAGILLPRTPSDGHGRVPALAVPVPPTTFPFIRNTLLVATGITMIGYVTYPTAPPRLAGIGIVDTVSNGHVDLNSGLVHSLYNPFAGRCRACTSGMPW